MPDPLIQLFRGKPEALTLLGRAWEVFYFEGNAPDVGKRRENFIIEMLREEFGLDVEQAPDTEKEWDFIVNFTNPPMRKKYSLKTSEKFTNVKMAWDGFPDEEHAIRKILNFNFGYDLMYVIGNREKHKIAMAVIESHQLRNIQTICRNDPSKVKDYWWIPKSGTNPRGFGLKRGTIKRLVENAKRNGNYLETTYPPLPADRIEELKRKYHEGLYKLIKEITSIE
jgi:hypothetical protein